ncbi:cupin domain-containing protein [Mucilaginibacter sp. dw_454]|uniref:cupin domain-containing protein n=1 Tax=Mucilaginibacter sp. dw_454 TaxID=2720079 RepID=UPI001BD59812|nr:cupin domain-containing protein [Mucilaginibacter sp. dw_454]
MSNPSKIIRKPLLTAELGSKQITTVEIKEIKFEPGQKTGVHFHPCPVTGYIASGSVDFQIEGEEEIFIPTGGAFYEPAGKTIIKFDNHSDTEPMTFIAFYLLNGNQELIKML